MNTFLRNILIISVLILVMALSSCSKRCTVNGCRVRMEHRHGGKKFKSKIRPWYAFQNPRVGRDYKRDKDPEKIPWRYDFMDEVAEEDLLVSNDTVGVPSDEFIDDEFMNDEFMDPDDSLGVANNDFAPQQSGKKKKKKGKRKGEEEELVQKENIDPWDIENITDEPIEEKSESEEKEETLPVEEEIEEPVKKKKTKEDKKKEKEEEKKKREVLDDEWADEDEEEEDDDWGF